MTEWIFALKDQFTAPIAGIQRALDVTDAKALKTESDLVKVGEQSGRMAGIFSSLGGIAAGALAGLGLAEIGRQIFTIGTDMEQVNMNYRTLLMGNTDLADKTVAQLLNFGEKTKFTNLEVLNAGEGLLAFGVKAESLLPTMQTLGDLSLGNSAKFQSLVDNYGKMVSAQRGNTMDLNQFALAGVPIWRELEAITGKTGGDLRKWVEQNGVSIDIINQAFARLTGSSGQFFEALKNASNTTSAKLGEISAGFESIANKIFLKLQPGINAMYDFGISILPKVETALKGVWSVVEPVGKFLWDMRDAIGAVAFAYAGYQTALIITTGWQMASYAWMMRSVIAESLLAFTTGGLTGAVTALNAAFWANPLAWVIGLLAAAGFAIYKLWQNSETFRATILGTWEAIKVLAAGVFDLAISPFVAWFKIVMEVGSALQNLFTLNFEGLKQNALNVVDILKSANPVAKIKQMGAEMGAAYNDGFNGEITRSEAEAKAGKKGSSIDSLIPGGKDAKATAATDTTTTTSSGSGSGGGSGSTRNVNVTIQRLGDIVIHASGMDDLKKHGPEIQRMIHEYLIAGVRDFETAVSST